MGITIVEPPASEPVSLAAAKLHLRVDHDAEDGLIADLVQAARELVEAFTGRALVTRRVIETRNGWMVRGDTALRLALAPVGVVHAVRVATGDGAMTAITAVQRLFPDAGLLWLTTYPAPARDHGGVEIECDAGYGEQPEACPAALRQAILITVASLYESREGGEGLPGAARMLAAPFARVKL